MLEDGSGGVGGGLGRFGSNLVGKELSYICEDLRPQSPEVPR